MNSYDLFMGMIVDDEKIRALLEEPKPELDPRDLVPSKRKRGHLEASKQVEGAEGRSSA